ncbi:MAG TPA: response regulator [Polyangiaceae bacterium]
MTESSAGGDVLLVDDEEELLRGVQRVLARAGFSVDAVSSGQAAVERLGHKVFDCIVSDINMPGMSGIDLLRAVRERDLDVPVRSRSATRWSRSVATSCKGTSSQSPGSRFPRFARDETARRATWGTRVTTRQRLLTH